MSSLVSLPSKIVENQVDESGVKLKFVTKFEKNYLRNNRLSTQKNLRCFPACPNTGHSTTGSCSCGCVIELSGVGGNYNSYTLIAELAPMCNEDLFTVENKYRAALIATAKSHNDIYRSPGTPNVGAAAAPKKIPKASLRDKDCWRAVYLPAADESVEQDKLTYFIRPSYWHYGWRSHKHMRFMQHSVRLYAFVNCTGADKGMAKCIARSTSTYFTVNSYKGKRIAESKGSKTFVAAKPKKKRKKTEKASTAKAKRSKTGPKKATQKKKTTKKSTKGKKSASKESSALSAFSPPSKADANALMALAAAALGGSDFYNYSTKPEV
jgi:hypothetical protein